MTRYHLNKIQQWLWKSKTEPRAIENIIPERLNELLSEFFVKINKENGENYEPSTLDGFKASIERYLKEKYYPESIITSRVFYKTREALKARKIAVKKEGLGRKVLASERLTLEDEQTLIVVKFEDKIF